jgi:hypothetical protein
MLYRVALYEPLKYESGFEVTRTVIVGTLKAAELYSKSILKPAYETTHSARYARLPFTKVMPVIRGRSVWQTPVATHETPVVYVPSCGDLGWCP